MNWRAFFRRVLAPPPRPACKVCGGRLTSSFYAVGFWCEDDGYWLHFDGREGYGGR